MKTIEMVNGNRLIARFMEAHDGGADHYDLFSTTWLNDLFADVAGDDPNAQHYHKPDEMKFHESWSWLMPVIDKIESLGYKVVMETGRIAIGEHMSDPVVEVIPEWENKNHKIGVYHNAIVRFIQWHNSQ